MAASGDVTSLLRRWQQDGDSEAEHEVFQLVERELLAVARRTLQREQGLAHKIEPAELIAEAYMALHAYPIVTPNRAPFFHLMAKKMRQILIDIARADRAAKRPQSRLRVVETNAMNQVAVASEIDTLDFYEALDALGAVDPRQADIVELRVVGLSIEEIAEYLHVSRAAVNRAMALARAFLAFRLGLAPDWIRA